MILIPFLQPGLQVQNLRVEHLDRPLGIDVAKPRLTWFVASTQKGDRSTGYQILAARSRKDLDTAQHLLWDSGKVSTGGLRAEYAGKPLGSGSDYFWKVRAWDAKGKLGPWSSVGFWSTGLLHRSDWKAQWITSPVLADPANRPRTPIHCYRSELSSDPNARKWITLDLGAARSIDRAVLSPARPSGLTFDIATVQFPRRFRLLAADSPDFRSPQLLVDQTGTDYPQPRGDAAEFKFAKVTARYVRLDVTRLGPWDAKDYGIFLAQFSLFSEGQNVSISAGVTASDSIENEHWSKRFLVDGKPHVEFSAFPPALDPKVAGAFSPSRTTMLRRDFFLDAPVRRATLYGTAKGFYEARLNGRKVGDDLLAPGFTDFRQRVGYATHDVTGLLHQGANTAAALLGYGWYAGHMNLGGNAYFYGFFPQFAAQLEIELTNGRRITIATDKQWRACLDGAVRWSDLLDGEACDFRKDQPGWDQPKFNASRWPAAWAQPLGSEKLVGQRMPSVRAIQEMKPLHRREVRPGVWVYDLGQEITGWVRLKAGGPAGTHIVLRHAEAVKPNGELDTASLWGTPQQDDYLLDGKGARTLEPHFTYHGFRYFEITGLASAPVDVVAVNVHNDFEEVGQFTCSNPLFNRLMTASKWTQRNLFFDVPAGCAARSERLAWTGDIRPCVQTALFNFDTPALFEKYSADLRDDQKLDGRFTDICPHAHLWGTDICVGSPGWADAGVSLPWELYVNTGDRRALAEHYEAAKRWVDFVHRQNPNLLWINGRGMDWGDWLSAGRATPKEIGSTAFFAHSTDLVARMARVLGRDGDAAAYGDLFKRIKAAFVARYVSAEGVIRLPASVDVTAKLRKMSQGFTVGNDALGGDPAPNLVKTLHVQLRVAGREEVRDYAEKATVDLSGVEILRAVYGAAGGDDDAQGSYGLALQFGLLDGALRAKALERLSAVIARDGGHPATGFWSSLEMMLALSEGGQHEVASRLANLTSAPSWGHMVTSGGTTFWEAFDADQKTLSLNHWTHSACGEWLWREVAGLSPDPARPGYEGFTVRPRPTQEATWCKASYRSVRGPIKIEWRLLAGKFTLDLQVPPGSVAQVYFPSSATAIREARRSIEQAPGVRFSRAEEGSRVYEVSSGLYRFTANALNR